MRRGRWLVPIVVVAMALPVAAQQAEQRASEAENPFFTTWGTPFGAPPFTAIKEEHFFPAFEKAIEAQRSEVEAIAANEEEPTFANTIEALDASGRLLDRVEAVFDNLNEADTTPALQTIAKRVTPLRSALRDDILLDGKLFERIEAVWAKRDTLDLTAEQSRLLEETRKAFVRGGARAEAAYKNCLLYTSDAADDYAV